MTEAELVFRAREMMEDLPGPGGDVVVCSADDYYESAGLVGDRCKFFIDMWTGRTGVIVPDERVAPGNLFYPSEIYGS